MCGKRRVHRVENNNLNYQTRLIWSVHNLHHVSDYTDTLKRRLLQQNLLMNSGSWVSRSRHHTMVDKLWDMFILQLLRDFSALALSNPLVILKHSSGISKFFKLQSRLSSVIWNTLILLLVDQSFYASRVAKHLRQWFNAPWAHYYK